MDAEIHEDLSKISKNVQAVGRSIGSKRIDIEGLRDCAAALIHSAGALEIYAKMQHEMDE